MGKHVFDRLTRHLGTDLPRRAIIRRAGALGLAALVPSLLSVPCATPLAAKRRQRRKTGVQACPAGTNFCCAYDESDVPFCLCFPKHVCPD